MQGSLVKRLAMSMGRLAFFEPETFTLPLSGLPPLITRKSELDDVMLFILLDNYFNHFPELGVMY